jgi:hypothetical protein
MILNTLLVAGLCFSLNLNTAFAKSPVGENFLNQYDYETQMRADLTEDISAQNISKIQSILLGHFTSAEDKAYFEKMATNYKPQKLRLSASEARGQVSIFGENVDVLLSQYDHSQKSLRINGVVFKFEQGKSLEFHAQKIVDILSGKKTARHNVLLKNLVLPEAQAGVLSDIGNSVFYILPKAVVDINTYSLQTNLDNVLESCKKRDGKTTYENSQSNTWLEIMASKGSYTLEGQRKISDCKAWVAKNEKSKDLGEARMLKLCSTGEQVLKCVDQYKAESEKPGPKPKSTETHSKSQKTVH